MFYTHYATDSPNHPLEPITVPAKALKATMTQLKRLLTSTWKPREETGLLLSGAIAVPRARRNDSLSEETVFTDFSHHCQTMARPKKIKIQ